MEIDLFTKQQIKIKTELIKILQKQHNIYRYCLNCNIAIKIDTLT